MNWRPWIITTLFFATSIVNGYLFVMEQKLGLPTADTKVEIEKARTDPLKQVLLKAAKRNSNMRDFGLPENLKQAAVDKAAELTSDRKRPNLEKLFKEASDQGYASPMAEAFCFEGDLHPRWAALEFLVRENDDGRQAIDPFEERILPVQGWFANSPVREVHDKLELAENRQPDATAMGIAAVIAGKEMDALEGRPPWGAGGILGNWSMSSVIDRNPGIDRQLVVYFGSMHAMAETAEAIGFCN